MNLEVRIAQTLDLMLVGENRVINLGGGRSRFLEPLLHLHDLVLAALHTRCQKNESTTFR